MRPTHAHRRAAHRLRPRGDALHDTRPAAPLGLTPTARHRHPSATLTMHEAVAARRAAGRETLHLGFGEASFPLPPSLREALATAAARTGYAPVLGIPALRAAIAAYLTRTRSLDTSPERIVVGPGSKPLIYALLHALEGDLLLPVPSWVSYAAHARLAGKRVISVETDPTDHLRLTPRALSAAYARARHDGADPRILVVNSPSNPTGGMLAPEDTAALAEWARSRGATLISDEIYAELAHGAIPHTSPARFYPEGTIVTGGMSKAFSAGGWRLGYAALPTSPAGGQLLGAVRALASEIWTAAATPIQEAAIAAFSPNPELDLYIRRSARLHAHATGRLYAALRDLRVPCPPPTGGFYLYPDFDPWRAALTERGIQTGLDLARHLLDQWDVAALPASEFGERPDALRLRLATSLLFEPEASAPPTDREAWLRALLERADALDDTPAEPLPSLPLLERAQVRLTAFVESLGPL